MKTILNRCLSFYRERASSVGMGLLLVVFLFILGCGALFAGETAPENPMGNGSSSLESEATVLDCEGETDENVYIPVPVASERTEGEEQELSDEALNEEEPETEPAEEEEELNEPDAQDSEPETEQKLSSASQSTTDAPASPGNNGIAGGNTENGNTTSEQYFTTSIKDGETVTSKDYSFAIRHKNPSLIPKEVQVFVNGHLVPQFNGNVELDEGKNTIRVKVDYVDASGKTVASPYKDYTVSLDTQSLVINTSLKDETVDRDLLSFTAMASYLGEDTPVTVKLNGEKVEGSNGSYRVRLKDGANVFVLSAAKNGLSKEETYTVTYVSSGIFDFETDLADGMTVSNANLSFSVWLVNSENAKISVRLNGGKTQQSDGNGKFTMELSHGENTVAITAKDGEQKVSRNYKIYFERQQATADQPFPDGEYSPTIQCNLTDPMTVNNSKYTVDLMAFDYKGNRLYSSNITVKLNGSPVRLEGENEKTTYLLNLSSPENEVTVFVKDDEGYNALYIYHLTYNRNDGPIGYATVSVEATTLGLGYIVPPTQVEVYDGEPASYVVKRLLDSCGIAFDYTGALDNGFYLARIYRENLVANVEIPASLLEYLDRDGASETGVWNPGSLGEMDFYAKSGWNIAVDEFYPNCGLSGVYLNDGQRLSIRFTLNLGRDIGGLNGAAGEYPEKFIESY